MTILIICKNSYTGNHIDEWLTNHGKPVNQLDVLNYGWKNLYIETVLESKSTAGF